MLESIQPNIMTNIPSEKQSPRRFNFVRLWAIFLHPRQAFAEIASETRASWWTPMIVLSVMALLSVIVSGYLNTRAAMMGEISLPPDWQYWTPDMQNNYMQAQQATQGPVFMYVIPLVGSLTSLWVGWIVLAGLLHLGSTLLGGRGSMQGALNIAGWAGLPFAVRDILRIVYMLSASHAITSPGLSGFTTNVFLSQVLALTDIFLFWNIVLLTIGFSISDGLSRGKALVGILVVLLLLISVQAGLGSLMARVGGGAF